MQCRWTANALCVPWIAEGSIDPARRRRTVHEIAAISGHKTLSEVQRYTNAADQARLARAAMGRIGNNGVKPEPGEVSNLLSGMEKKLG